MKNSRINSDKYMFIEHILEALEYHDLSIETLETCSAQLHQHKNYHMIVFPNGLREVAGAIELYYDEQMLKNLPIQAAGAKVTAKVSIAVVNRITTPQKYVLYALRDFYSSKLNYHEKIRSAYGVCDKIWQYAGDKSLDHNYYTKRTILLGVYMKALRQYLEHPCMEHNELDEYVQQSIQKVANSIKFIKNMLNVQNIPFIRAIF